MISRYQPFRPSALALTALALLLFCHGCTNRPLVRGLLEPGGTIYRESEGEEWGSRTTVKVRGFDF